MARDVDILRKVLSRDDLSIPDAEELHKGMKRRAWLALCVAADLDDATAWSKLARLLYHQATTSRPSGKPWPAIERRLCACGRKANCNYIADLCTLAMRELQAAEPMSVRERATWFGVSEKRWQRSVASSYAAITASLAAWHTEGIRHLQKRAV